VPVVEFHTGFLPLVPAFINNYALRYEMARVLGLFGEGKIKAVVDEVLPLEEANEAFRRLKEGEVVGRTVLRVSEG